MTERIRPEIYPPADGRSPLERLIDAASGSTLANSDEVRVHQDDLRLVLGQIAEVAGAFYVVFEYAGQMDEFRVEYRHDAVVRLGLARERGV